MPDAGGTRIVPMFPLGMVLVPGAVLPLHVFEPRYRALVGDVLTGDREFGVVLIERGSEVGGGDTRSHYGTVARVRQAEELPDGRWAMIAVGDRRLRVKQWLPDDPYPRARVEDWPDEPDDGADVAARYEAVGGVLRTALALGGELGLPVPPVDSSLPTDPASGSFAVAALAPVGPLDRQQLLGAPGVAARLDLAEKVITEQVETFRAQLRMTGD